MAKVKTNIGHQTDEELKKSAEKIETGLTDNPTVFTDPDPTVAIFHDKKRAFIDKCRDILNAEQALGKLHADLNTVKKELEDAIRTEGNYVQKVSNGDESIIKLGGFSVVEDATPAVHLSAVTGFGVTTGDNEGEMDMHWNPLKGRKHYQIQISYTPEISGSFKDFDTTTFSKFTAKGLTPGVKCYARVIAVNAAGRGDYCIYAGCVTHAVS